MGVAPGEILSKNKRKVCMERYLNAVLNGFIVMFGIFLAAGLIAPMMFVVTDINQYAKEICIYSVVAFFFGFAHTLINKKSDKDV